ncbi:MAG: hypothetical protein WDN49_16635 [Acetobacteraceae bacterium]
MPCRPIGGLADHLDGAERGGADDPTRRAARPVRHRPYSTVLEPGEIVRAVRIPKPAGHFGYHKLCRKPGEFAHAMAAVLTGPAVRRSRHRRGRRPADPAGGRPGQPGLRPGRPGLPRPGGPPYPARRGRPRAGGGGGRMTRISLVVNGAPVAAECRDRARILPISYASTCC